MDQRRKRKEETAQTVSFPKSSEPLQISERTLRMLRQNTVYERNNQPQNNIVSNPAASRGMGGHSMGGAVRKPSAQSAPQAQMNLYSALSAGASGNPLAMAAGPTRLYTPEEISVRAQAQRQAQQNLNAGSDTYFDDPRDYYRVLEGIHLYYRNHPNQSQEEREQIGGKITSRNLQLLQTGQILY